MPRAPAPHGDLVSWWPFLCFAVLTYGLLPRLILLFMGFMVHNRALLRINFSHRACQRLLNRMRTPLFSTGGRLVSPEDLRNGDTKAPGARVSDSQDLLTGKGMIALVPDDIFEVCTDDELESVISRTFGSPIQRRLSLPPFQPGTLTPLLLKGPEPDPLLPLLKYPSRPVFQVASG